MNSCRNFIYGLLLVIIPACSYAQHLVTINAGNPVATVSQDMGGVFFEDINFGADGGLYAEMVKNRSFEFASPMMGWKEVKQGTGS